MIVLVLLATKSDWSPTSARFASCQPGAATLCERSVSRRRRLGHFRRGHSAAAGEYRFQRDRIVASRK
jgi:hypothetical protein